MMLRVRNLYIIFIPLFLMILNSCNNKRIDGIAELKNYNIVAFGAVGDGKTINTNFIQKAIDQCYREGGGLVIIPDGTFLTGSLFLKSNVTLFLSKEGVLLGSDNKDDYIPVNSKDDKGRPRYGNLNSFLIYSENSRNVKIEGEGKIIGNGHTFWEDEFHDNGLVLKPKEWRPRALVHFVNSQNIEVRGVSLENSPTYTLWPLGCDTVIIDNINIKNRIDGPNTDGIDIDCSRYVRIQNCNIVGGDDAIAIKSDAGRLGEEIRPCEDVEIENCTLSSPPACGIRFGYEGDSPIRNVYTNNIRILNTSHGIDMLSVLPDVEYPFYIERGSKIHDIIFNNIVMEDVKQPIYFWMGTEKEGGNPDLKMSDISINNLSGRNVGQSFISGSPAFKIKNLSLSNIHFTIKDNYDGGIPFNNVWGSNNPYLIYFNDVDNIKINNLEVNLINKAVGNWESIIKIKESKQISVKNLLTRGAGNLDIIKTFNIEQIKEKNIVKE